MLDDLEQLVREQRVDIRTPQGFDLLVDQFGALVPQRPGRHRAAASASAGPSPACPTPRAKTFAPRPGRRSGSSRAWTREEIIARLETVRGRNELADLAFYAYRDLNRTEAEPFLKAALERSPVSIAAAAD